jgi:hypothetical protein
MDSIRDFIRLAGPFIFVAGGGFGLWEAISTHAKGLQFLAAAAFFVVSLALTGEALFNGRRKDHGRLREASINGDEADHPDAAGQPTETPTGTS